MFAANHDTKPERGEAKNAFQPFFFYPSKRTKFIEIICGV